MRRIALVLAALVAFAAPAGAAIGAERFQRHVVRGYAVSLAVPASWVAVDSRVPPAVIARFSRDNPKLAPFLQQLSLGSSPMKFLALDPVVRSDFATNVNVVVAPLPSGLTFAGYQRGLAAEVRAIGARGLQQRAVTIRGARALRLQYRFAITAGTRSTVQTLQYGFMRPGRSVVVTYTTLPSLAGRYAATFQRSAASIRFSG